MRGVFAREYKEENSKKKGYDNLRRRIIEREGKITWSFEKYERERRCELIKLPREKVSFMNFIRTYVLREIEGEQRK